MISIIDTGDFMKKVPTATCALRDRYIVSIERVYTHSTFYMKSAVIKLWRWCDWRRLPTWTRQSLKTISQSRTVISGTSSSVYLQGISEKCTGAFKFGCRIIFWSIYLSESCRKSGVISLFIHRIHTQKKITLCFNL